MQIIAEYYLIYSQIVFSHLHFCFFRLLPVSLSFRLPGSCLSILIFVHFAYLCSFRLSSFISLIFVHFARIVFGHRLFEPPHISTKLGRSPVSLFLRSFRPNDIRLHRHRSKTAFFLPLLQKKSQLSCKYPFFFVPLHRNWSNGRFLLDKTAEFQQHRIHPRIALRDNIFNNKHYYYFAFEKKKA